jgi:predicted acyltransferase
MPDETRPIPSGRVVSIDALRGFDMFWITGGGDFFGAVFLYIGTPLALTLNLQLEHSSWNGFTFWDLIFPLFLFIVGASMPFALSKRIERGDSRKELYIHIFKRSLTLLVLGFIYNGLLDFDLSNFRYTGVLHRIAVCYLITALIVMNTKVKGQAIIAGAILLIYWAIMAFIPVPGFGAGMLTPEGNLAAWIDQHFLPGKFCCYGFGDNEGILSTIPAVSTTIIGVLAGHWLRSSASQNKKAIGLFLAGLISLNLALIWKLFFPINKLIWTSSYVLYAASWSLFLLGLFYWIIDVRGYARWAFPFVVIGLNPITIYVAQSLFDFGIIANIFIHGFIEHFGSFKPVFWAFCVLAVKWLFLYFLYRKKIFLKA